MLIFPARANTFVPFDFSVPIALNASGPFKIIYGILAHVSTLLTFVGFPYKPFTAGNGGFKVGSPRFPSIEWIKAVSSPQTNAPAPYLIKISKLKSVPKIFLPINQFLLVLYY